MLRERPDVGRGRGAVRLRLRVHLRALVRSPIAYLQGVAWRCRGLKLRARHRFSALMGQIDGAYDLWIATREPDRHRDLMARSGASGPSIDVVIDARNRHGDAAASLASICAADPAHAGSVFVLGGESPGFETGQGVTIVAEAGQLVSRLGRFVIDMKAGDTLSPVAFAAYRMAIAQDPAASVFYADDDLVDAGGKRHAPHFKPRWNGELARHHDFLSGSGLHVFDAKVFDTGQGPLPDWPPRAPGQGVASAPVHVPYVLHHRIERPRPARVALPAEPARTPLPHVSVVIPTRNQAALLRTCLEGLRATDYPSFDVTVIDNGSDDAETLALLGDIADHGFRVVRDPGPFNYAAMHNRAIRDLAGPLVCLLNNDIEIVGRDWLARMVPHALRADVGAVGAMLLYPDGTVQHAGIVTGIGGGAGHAHRLEPAQGEGYFARARLPQFTSGVTAACLVVEKAKFEAVGGFDAQTFAVAFNDVDLCLKLNAQGWQSFYEPRAVLVHHESKSRGFDRRGAKRRRFAGELAALKARWETDRKVDPFHHPELSPFCEQFVVRL